MTTRPNDFPLRVKDTLAARAGHRCSVCPAPTIGPGAGPGLVVKDGIAAHITAASPTGPRYDRNMTDEQRRSEENGIWVCTKHGREIDSVASAYSVSALRGLKRSREREAAAEFQRQRKEGDDASKLLLEFPYAETELKLFQIIARSPTIIRRHPRSTTSSSRAPRARKCWSSCRM